jgi:hypothetical protein
VIELDTDESRKPRRPRAWLYLAAIVLVAAVAGAAFLVHSSGKDQLRFEVETRSGTALRITWNVDVETAERVKGAAPGKGIPTPWSTTVTVEKLDGTATLMAMSTEADVVTCRITANGETVAEGSRNRAMGCVFNLADLAG